MKKLASLALTLAGMVGLSTLGTGCVTPAHTPEENAGRVLRTWDYEYKQMNEDIIYELMLDPPSRTTIWNLR